MIKFLHISDYHYLDPKKATTSQVQRNYVSIAEKWLQDNSFANFDFIAVTGDITNDGDLEDYRAFKAFFESQLDEKFPIIYMPGNHDVKEYLRQVLLNELDFNYVLEVKGYRIIVLDTASEEHHHGRITSDQMDWLASQLRNPSLKGTLIFQHHPYEIIWKHEEEKTIVPEGFYQLLQKSDVKAIFTGHLHMFRQSIIQTIPQYTVAPMSIGINYDLLGQLYSTNRLGYNVVTIHNDVIDVYSEIFQPELSLVNP